MLTRVKNVVDDAFEVEGIVGMVQLDVLIGIADLQTVRNVVQVFVDCTVSSDAWLILDTSVE